MSYWLKLLTLLLPALAVLSGCLATGGKRSAAYPREVLDRYTLVESMARSRTGCEFSYRVYVPQVPVSSTHVMLGHGFLRNQNKLIDLSRFLANNGVPVVSLNFCNMRPWNGNHEQNAADMRALAATLGAQNDIIYAGFSAGGLAAILAADKRTKAILTLDLVDQAKLGLNAVQRLDAPLIGLHGPPSRCNANNNGLALFNARETSKKSASTLVPDASHCEFESPSNWLCEFSCGDEDSREHDDATRQRVIHQVFDFIEQYLEPSFTSPSVTSLADSANPSKP